MWTVGNPHDELERSCFFKQFGKSFESCGQATKGVWGMSWRQEAVKGVEVCEKPGGVDKRTVIPGFLNWHVLNT